MRIIIANNYQDMGKRAAQIVASHIHLNPQSVLGLATGGTPIAMYKSLISMHREEGLDFSEVKTFNLDEYIGLNEKDENSYHYYMHSNFFDHVNIQKENINIPSGIASDSQRECEDYEAKIEEAGGIDVQILGIGNNGHIGFNEPDLKFDALTHIVDLDEETIAANSRFFNDINEVPRQAITMGIKTIMRAKKIILLANGENKAEILRKSLTGEITPAVPASILQLHRDVTVIADREASKYLED